MLKLFRKRKNQPVSAVAWSLSPDAQVSVSDQGVVFLHLGTGQLFRSNRVGAAIWRGIADGQDLPAIAARIGGEYAVPENEVLRDASRFVAALKAEGFLAGHARAETP